MQILHLLQYIDFLILCVWIALITPKLILEDIRSYTLPNRLVLPGWIVVFALFLFRWITTGRADLPILAAALVAFVGFAGFAFAGVLGMGDAKLAFVLAGSLAFADLELVIVWVICSFLFGGLFAIFLSIKNRSFLGVIPFGPFMLCAWWTAYFLFVSNTLTATAIPFS